MDDRLVVARIEVDTRRLDCLHASLAQQLEHLLMNQFNTFTKALDILARRCLQGAFEIVDDGQQAGQRACRRGVCLIAPIPIDTFAIVIELRRGSQQLILQRVLLPTGRLELRFAGFWLGLRFRGRSRRFLVVHPVVLHDSD